MLHGFCHDDWTQPGARHDRDGAGDGRRGYGDGTVGACAVGSESQAGRYLDVGENDGPVSGV